MEADVGALVDGLVDAPVAVWAEVLVDAAAAVRVEVEADVVWAARSATTAAATRDPPARATVTARARERVRFI